jgi:hypothetical protein
VLGDGRAALELPAVEGVASWRVTGQLTYADHLVSWTQDGGPGGSLEVELPSDGRIDPAQDEWLSRVQVLVDAVGSDGAEVGSSELEPMFVVWEGGPDRPPTWVDAATRGAVAPLGAWSVAAKDGLEASATERSSSSAGEVSLTPPRGGR